MSPLARVLVTLFLGGFGVHKFIDGQIGKGILYLFTGGLFGIGWIVDICKAVANLLNDQSPSPSASASSVTDNFEPHSYSDYFRDDCKFRPCVPNFINGTTLQYKFEISFTPINEQVADILWNLTKGDRFTPYELIPHAEGESISLAYLGSTVANISFKSDMFKDWEKNGEPVKIFLTEADKDAGIFKESAYFYRDRRIGYASREQSVVALVAYKSRDKQEGIALLSQGQEVEIEEAAETGHSATVTYLGDSIGNLPAAISRRVLEDPPVLAVFEKAECVCETKDGDIIEQPYIRIYW